MAEYDDFDEMYGDDYETMLEMEGATQNTPKLQAQLLPTQLNNHTSETTINFDVQPAKRALEELFGEIDDLLAESPYIDAPLPKKSKKDPNEQDLQLINRILQLREASKYQLDSLTAFGASQSMCLYKPEYSESYEMPKWPYVIVKQFDGRKKYVRYHFKEFEDVEVKKLQEQFSFEGGVSNGFKETWIEARNIIKNHDEITRQENNKSTLEVPEMSLLDSKSLWVEKYKPKRYVELLSDESTNRILLRWVKQWDKVVFNKGLKIKPVVPAVPPIQGTKMSKFDKFQKFQKQDVNLKFDEDGRPEFKVALLCGPPGLGKTTLAHLVARHAGYNPVEVNASDDRSVNSFRTTLERGTQMRSVLDRDNRPNCIVFDEIDGAPPVSIEFLIKYINGTYKVPRKTAGKARKDKKAQVLKRPIICICNDMYVPALRPLRQISFLVNFPPTESARLAERLLEISIKQTIQTNLTTLLALSEKSNNDIRSCLSVLQFFRAQNKPVRLEDILKASIGQKDVHKGLYSIWQDVFQIQRPKNKDKDQELTAAWRMRNILTSIQSFGDYDRVMHGIFENYPNMKVKGDCIPEISASLEWFSSFDLIHKRMLHTQNYSLNAYLPYAFVVWHFTFAGFAWQRVQYPSTDYEARTKQLRNAALLSEIIKGTQPYLKPYVHKKNLSEELLPYLWHIIKPSFRSVNTHLYTEMEKQRLHDIVAKMIDYNVTYIQERTVDGEYVYNIDPNICSITEFSTVVKKSDQVSYWHKQLLSREIELEKMRRSVHFKMQGNVEKSANICKEKDHRSDKAVPNHLQQLQIVKHVHSNKSVSLQKDIFQNIIQNSEHSRVNLEIINDVWFHYNEGFTNAVRRPSFIKDLV